MLGFCWRRLEDMLPAQVYKAVRRSIFSNFAKFVLSVFDLEDFERVCNMDNRYESYSAFISKLQQVESGSGPLVAIAEGRMDVADFSDLREHEVGEILQTYEFRACRPPCIKGVSWGFCLWPGTYNALKPWDVKLAMKEMREYVPLMEDYKSQLTLEFMHDKGFRVLDTSFLEAWKGVDLQAIIDSFRIALAYEQSDEFKKFEDLGGVEGMTPPAFANSESNYFVMGMRGGLFGLACLKQSALQKFQEATTFPLTCGVFGNFADEVLEVVKIANHRRRMEGDRFIGVHHVLFGLSLSRVGATIQRILHLMQG
ncbi:hypothetical protein RHMOL_Rhmol12G0170000 [Rhododendron molle]|uniref:Uncharacterized protein n=1 Tax=Rhododendron molle TaxID=49168 RepID=A0ACC0LJ42_RHOML|nr:hypothetical protein RHMOL_Rhmol12G0170000 [Rhododendron molle]